MEVSDDRKLREWKKYMLLEAKERRGELKRSEIPKLAGYRHLHGSGFFSSIKDKIKSVFATRQAFSNADEKVYNSVKDKRIVKIEVVRTPLSWASQQFANIASLGTFGEQAKRLGYDRVYHLYMLLYIEGVQQPIHYEKNETIVFRFGSPSTNKFTEKHTISGLPADLTVGKFVETAKAKTPKEQFWRYKFDSFNCQRFVIDNLQANGLLTESLKTWILQDAGQLLAKAPSFMTKLAQAGSDVAAFARKITGKGLDEEMPQIQLGHQLGRNMLSGISKL